MKLSLPDNLHSPEQLEAVLFDLDSYIGYRRRQAAKTTAVPDQPAASWSPQLEALLGEPEATADTGLTELEALAAELSGWRDAPVVSITLPARPSARLRSELVRWFRSQVSDRLLIRFSINSEVVGGMVVRTTSRIYDWSFRRQLTDHQDVLIKALREVDHA